MGRRSATESVARIFAAFLRQRTWSQAALARELEIGVPALRKRLDELAAHGVPFLEPEGDPPHVYWSVPPNWFPDSVAFSRNEVPDLLHVLRHAPRSRRRDKLLQLVFDTRRDRSALAATASAIITPDASDTEEAFLPIIEDAIAQRRPVRMRFYSTNRGVVETRHASVHRVEVGSPTRLVATCHRASPPRSRGGPIEAGGSRPRPAPCVTSPPRSRGGPIEARSPPERRNTSSASLHRVRAVAPLKRCTASRRLDTPSTSPPRSRGGPIEAGETRWGVSQ